MRRFAIIGLFAALLSGMAGFPWSDSPVSTQKCTPTIAPRVCLYVYGTGLHVDSFNVQFAAGTQGGTIIVKFMVRQGGPSGAIIEGPTGNKTYALDGQWHGWSFASGANFPNNTIVCGEVAHVAGPDYSTQRPCATIHS